MKPSPRS
ncbi:hypothetical protein D044_2770A, partial [Vibrio parahaemolyticus EKP-026]